MKGISHIRIDDRLIHGQVATRWVSYYSANRIMVIDDQVSCNDVEKSILRMAAPAGVNTSIISTQTAIENISSGKYEGQRVLVLAKKPEVIKALVDGGVDIKEFNIGNMSNRPDTTQIKRSVSVTEGEKRDIMSLIERGVKITARMVPDDGEELIISFSSNYWAS
ncbi:PTS sugar transporter subunit IIB [Aeromonas enteropelogenes]|uniref:PTS sugar transporter subunit IIB n=1 Tax=Aeromonas enteropelogenes TaxID=29489 RepID=UPI003BA1569D